MIVRGLRSKPLQSAFRQIARPLCPQRAPPGQILSLAALQRRTFTSSFRTLKSDAPDSRPKPPTPGLYAKPHRPAPRRNPDEPIYELTFTCKKCQTRSSHTVSKQGYHKGTVLITCPGCSNRHLISDHLRIFSDASVTIEDIMRENGELVKKGMIDAEGDVEFWAPEEEAEAKDAQDGEIKQVAGGRDSS